MTGTRVIQPRHCLNADRGLIDDRRNLICRNQHPDNVVTFCAMSAILFKCPITRQHVSAWVAEGVHSPSDGDARPETITCVACRQFEPQNGQSLLDQ
jgi:hypothetical protein